MLDCVGLCWFVLVGVDGCLLVGVDGRWLLSAVPGCCSLMVLMCIDCVDCVASVVVCVRCCVKFNMHHLTFLKLVSKQQIFFLKRYVPCQLIIDMLMLNNGSS